MSYCLHDVNCPGHGPDHERAMRSPGWNPLKAPPGQKIEPAAPMSKARLKRAARTTRANLRGRQP